MVWLLLLVIVLGIGWLTGLAVVAHYLADRRRGPRS
jgi:hypothetical protein